MQPSVKSFSDKVLFRRWGQESKSLGYSFIWLYMTERTFTSASLMDGLIFRSWLAQVACPSFLLAHFDRLIACCCLHGTQPPFSTGVSVLVYLYISCAPLKLISVVVSFSDSDSWRRNSSVARVSLNIGKWKWNTYLLYAITHHTNWILYYKLK